MLLGGPRRYTRQRVAELSGVSPEDSRRLWRALGFATVGDDEVVFTEGDVAALRQTTFLAEHGLQDDEMITAMTRMLGQTFSRLAQWQGQLLIELLGKRPELLESEDEVAGFVLEILPALEQVQAFVWRRQLAAYFSRITSQAAAEVAASGSQPCVVGFADMAGFTTLTRRATESELRELLEAFEAAATDVVANRNGRIVKALGDEVLFVADTVEDGAEIGLQLQAAAEDDPRLPALRIGLAAGPVLGRLGDVYGSTVNIASRLTSICRPGWILVDRMMAEALRDDERYSLKSRRPESVRGFHHLHQWRLRRAGDKRARR
ncbi:MAG: adenylate cyclase [Pseudonocardiales bacterium]|nr:adenylate cyclase [Pseudonocardiales bacterium]